MHCHTRLKRVFFILFLCSFGQANVFSQYANIENDSLLVLGNKIYRTGDYVQSQKIYEQAISVHSKNPQSKEWIIAAIGLGASILDQGRILEGVSWIQKADSSITDSISLELQAYAKSNLGWATWWMGYSKKALPVYEQALNLANRSGDEYRIAQISNSLSLLSRFLGRYSDAILYAKKAHDYFEKINDPYLLNISKGNLLAAYDALGFVEKAETLLLEAINIKNDIGNSDLLSTNYQKLANLYLKKGEYDKSLVYQSKNLAIANNSVNPIEKILALKEIGNTYVLMREHLKALDYLNESQKVRVEKGYQKDGHTAHQIGIVYLNLGENELAEELFNEALALFIEYEEFLFAAEVYLNLADLSIAADNQKQAIKYSNKMIEIAFNTESEKLKARSYALLSRIYSSLNDTEQALNYSKKAYNSASIFSGYKLAEYLVSLAQSYHPIDPDSALFYADKAFTEIDRIRGNIYGDNLQSLVFSDFSDFYSEVAYWYLKDRNDSEGAFNIIETGKSKVLLEKMAASSSIYDLVDEVTILQLRQKEKVLDNLYRSLEDAKEPDAQTSIKDEIRLKEFEYDSFINELYLKNPTLKTFTSPSVMPVGEITKLLDRSSAIIEYAFHKNKLLTFWVTKSGIESTVTEIETSLSIDEYFSTHVYNFRNGIETMESKKTLETFSKPLHSLLFKPFTEKHPEKSNIVIVPVRSLSVLPFEALIDNGKFLIEKLSIKYLPSVSIYPYIKNPHRDVNKDLLAVAGSGFTTESGTGTSSSQKNFVSLPAALIEVDSIASKFDEVTILKNEQVSESVIKSLRLDQYKYLHFATHGSINEQNPLQSGLIISRMSEFENSFGEDGYLNSLEISQLSLNSDLVVLSACKTGMGKMIAGEGILGLQRSFFKAGTSSVVVSLWDVYDKSTAELMSTFYNKLLVYEGEDIGLWSKFELFFDIYDTPLFGYKERALRDSKLTMLNHPYYDHPIHWASFILIGK